MLSIPTEHSMITPHTAAPWKIRGQEMAWRVVIKVRQGLRCQNTWSIQVPKIKRMKSTWVATNSLTSPATWCDISSEITMLATKTTVLTRRAPKM